MTDKLTFAEEQEKAYRFVENPVNRDYNRYNINKFTYPEDAGNSPDLQHTLVFYINVRGSSQYKKAGKYNIDYQIADEQMIKRNETVVAAGVGGVGAVVGVAWAGVLSNFKSLGGAAARKIVGNNPNASTGAFSAVPGTAIMATLGTAAVAYVASRFEENTMFRLKDAIVLAVQEPPKTSYRVNYDKWDAGILIGGMSDPGASVIDMGNAGLMKFAQVPSMVGAPDFMKGIQKATGTAINPYRTTLFQDVELRTFTFNYKFMPKTANEAKNVLEIINTFKFHMHPEFDSSKVFLIHPSEFNIVYCYNGKENKKWNSISTCVLTEMELDAGTEQLASFADGQSVEINMRLVFLETEMLTKERIEKSNY